MMRLAIAIALATFFYALITCDIVAHTFAGLDGPALDRISEALHQ
jgi:hypothetical protein